MKKSLILIVSGTVFFACRKEKTNAPGCPITVANISGAYKLTALQYKASANAASQDYLAYMDDCEKDDIISLKSDGTYKEEDAGAFCSPPNTAEGTWQLHGNTLTSDGRLNGTVAGFDCKTLVYYIENALKQGDRLTYTMEKQ